MKVFIYLRVSTETQQLDPQRSELLALCAKEGWQVAGEFSDILSGTKRARPGLNAMLAACRSGGTDAVLAVKIDRLARSVADFSGIVETLKTAGVGLLVPAQGIDTRKGSAAGELLLTMLSAIAAFERTLIQERTIAGLATARAAGVKLGRGSVKLVENWPEVLATWQEEGGMGYGELARRLGGVSKNTAWKLAKGKLRANVSAGKSSVSTEPSPWDS